MKNEFFFILICIYIFHIPEILFSQRSGPMNEYVNYIGYNTYLDRYFEARSSFSDYNEFEEFKNRWDKYEFENMLWYGDLKTGNVIWGNPSYGGKTVTWKLSSTIGDMDKREFKDFAKFITRDLLVAYIQFKQEYSMAGDRLIFASPNLFTGYPNGIHWLNSKGTLEENDIDINKFSVDPSDIKFEFTYGDTSRMVAKAHSPLKDDIRIIINIDKWEELNNYQRIWLIIHEWGHEAFGMEHGDNKIMYPLMPEEELSKKGYTNSEIVSMFDDLKKEITFRFDNGPNADNPYIDRERQIDREFNRIVTDLNKADRQTFSSLGGRNYSNILFGDRSTPPIAFNVLFDAVLDFFDDLIENRSFIWKRKGSYYIANENSSAKEYHTKDCLNIKDIEKKVGNTHNCNSCLNLNKYYIIIDEYQFPDVLGDPKNSMYRDWKTEE